MITTTYTLLILIYGGNMGDTPPALATVPGFTLKSACIKEGQQLKNQRPRTDNLYYECIEVQQVTEVK